MKNIGKSSECVKINNFWVGEGTMSRYSEDTREVGRLGVFKKNLGYDKRNIEDEGRWLSIQQRCGYRKSKRSWNGFQKF